MNNAQGLQVDQLLDLWRDHSYLAKSHMPAVGIATMNKTHTAITFCQAHIYQAQ